MPALDENEEFEFAAAAMKMRNPTNIVKDSQAQNFKPFTLPDYKGHQSVSGGNPFGGGGPSPDIGGGSINTVQGIPWSDQERQMAKDGIDIVSGAPYALRNRLSLLVRPDLDQTKSTVNDFFGKDVGVTKNKYGEIQYNDPSTGRPTTLDSHSHNLGNLAPTAGGAMDTTLSGGGATIGGVATGLGTGNPALAAGGAMLGSAVGQVISDAGKVTINSILGTGNKDNPQETITDIGKNAAESAALTGAGELVGNIPNVGRFLARGFLGLKFGEAQALQEQIKPGLKAVQDYQTLIGNNAKINPSIAELVPQRTSIKFMSQQAFRATPELTEQENMRVQGNLDSLSANYDTFAAQFKPTDKYEIGSSGYNMKEALEQKKALQLNQLQLQNAVDQESARRQAGGLPPLTETERNQLLTDTLNVVEQAGKQKKDQAYGDLKVMLGAPKEVAYDRNSDYWLQARTPDNVMPYDKTTQIKLQNIWQEGMNAQNSPLKNGEKYWAAIPDGFLKNPAHPEYGLALDESGNIARVDDIFSVLDNVQDIKSGVRSRMRATNGQIPADEQTQAHVAEILEDNIGNYLERRGDPRILDAWENAKQANTDYMRNFRAGLLNQVMTREGGFQSPVYTTATTKLLMSAGKGQDQSGIATFANILKGDPTANENVRSMIWSIFKEHYMPDGIPTAKNFAKFKDDMEGPMKYFFGDDDVANMSTFEQMTQAMDASAKRVQNFNKAWRASPEYGGIPMNSGALTNAVFRTNGVPPQVLDKMVTFLKGTNPTLLKEWQADTAAEFARRTSDANGVPDARTIASELKVLGPRLAKMMDPRYVQNVQTIAKGAKIATGGAVQEEPDKPQSILTKIVQTIWAPPLSAEGRAYSGILSFRKKAAGRVVYNALSSPEALNDFISKTAQNAATPTVAGVIADLNGRAWWSSLNHGNGSQRTAPQTSSIPRRETSYP